MKINGERHFLWREVDEESTVLEAVIAERRYPPILCKKMKHEEIQR